VKKRKVNSPLESGSQCNIIYVDLVNEIFLETYEHLCPCSMSWLQNTFSMRFTRHCKVKFSINIDFVDEVEYDVAPLDVCDLGAIVYGIEMHSFIEDITWSKRVGPNLSRHSKEMVKWECERN
jgi:hypothetical protein